MKRLAYCSPVNPLPSGISDYSEELLPYLGRFAEITLFVPDSASPSNRDLKRWIEIRPMDDLPRLNSTRPFDAILYHIGNSPVHAQIYEHAQRLPGIVVLHEWVLHHFKLWYAATRRGKVDCYLREMAERYGERGAAVARRMARGQFPDDAFVMPLAEDVIDRAVGLIGHSHYVVERARGWRPHLPSVVVPMGVPLPRLIEVRTARRALDLPVDVPIWASFGHINPYKRMEPALRAFRRFREWEPDARYILVGSVSPTYDLRGLIRRLGLADAVEVTGYVSAAAFRSYVAAADICLNLRYPTAGETSASLLRLLGAGKPTLVSAVGALDELPQAVCCKVDPGSAEGDQILSYTRLLQLAPMLGDRLGRGARQFVAEQHSLDRAAQGYLDFLAELYGWESVAPQRAPLWQMEEEVVPALGQPPGGAAVPTLQDAPAPPSPELPRPMLDLARDAGSALAELGQRAEDRALADAASAIADLMGADEPAEDRPMR